MMASSPRLGGRGSDEVDSYSPALPHVLALRL